MFFTGRVYMSPLLFSEIYEYYVIVGFPTEVCACISISNNQQYSVWHTESYADFYKDTIHHSTLYIVLKIIHTTV